MNQNEMNQNEMNQFDKGFETGYKDASQGLTRNQMEEKMLKMKNMYEMGYKAGYECYWTELGDNVNLYRK